MTKKHNFDVSAPPAERGHLGERTGAALTGSLLKTMTSSPPSKKFRQATIWEGFKRQRSVTSVTGTGAGSAEAAAASADLGGATRKRKKSQEENDLEGRVLFTD